jgi:peptidyl-prolyl cis-trans isomerase D
MREYNEERQRIRNASSIPLSDKELNSLNIKSIVLDNLITRAVFDQALKGIGIIIPKKSVLSIIQSIPDFQIDGIFSEKVYEDAIRRSGISEAGFLAQIRDNLERTQLLYPLVASYKIPLFIKEQIAKEFESVKTIVLAKLNVSDMKIDENIPTEDTRQYFDVNKEKYQNPERRNISILFVDNLAASGDELKVSKKEIDERYEEVKSSFTQEETRDFERFAFERREDADKAWNVLNAGTPSEDVKKKFAVNSDFIRDTHLSDFPEQFGDTLFELTLNQTSTVCAVGNQFYVYRCVKINAPKQQESPQEIKEKIAKDIQNEKLNSPEAYEKIKLVRNKVDDGFGAGKNIDEVAKDTGLRVAELKDFDLQVGNPELVKLVPDEATRKEIIENTSRTDAKQATQTIESKENDTLSYVVYVRNIKKANIPEFDKISEKVKKDYINEKKGKEAETQVRAIVNKGLDACGEVLKLKDTKSYKVSKKDVIMAVGQKTASQDTKDIMAEIPNPNVLLNTLGTMKKGEAIDYKLPDGNYVIIALKESGSSIRASDEFGRVVANYIDSGASKDVVPVAMKSFRKMHDVDVDEELVEELVKVTDKDDEGN